MLALWSKGEAYDDENKRKMGECRSTLSTRQGGANCGKIKNNQQQRMTQWPEGKTSGCWSSHISRMGQEKTWILQAVWWMLLAVKKWKVSALWHLGLLSMGEATLWSRLSAIQHRALTYQVQNWQAEEMGSRNSRDLFLSTTYLACTSRKRNKTEDGAVLPKKMNERIDTIGW